MKTIPFPAAFPRPLLLCALPALMLGVLMLMLAQAGYTAEDDAAYLFAADQWLKGPFLGVNHWHLRHPHVLAIAGSMALFGRSEAAMMLPTIASYLGIIVITTWLVRRIIDDRAAIFAGLIFAATPVFTLYAKIPYPDVSETFYCLASLALLWKGLETQRWRWFILSGAAMAMAWLIRSSSIPFILFYGLLFLIGYRVPRSRYLAMALGFVPPVLAEWTYYLVEAGTPFYRFAVDMGSLEISTAHMTGGVANGLRPPFNVELMSRWKPNSIVDVHWAINPYIDFLTSPSFGFLYWAGIAGAALMLWRKDLARGQRQFVLLLLLLGALWIFTSIYVLNLRPQPRYFLPASWCMGVLAGMAISAMMRSGARWPLILLAILLLPGMILVTARRDPMGAERQLVTEVAQTDRPVVSDLKKARFLLEERGLQGRVRFIDGDTASPAQNILTSSDAVEDWQARGRYRVETIPAPSTLPDRIWTALAPQALLHKLRPERNLVLLHPLSCTNDCPR